MRDDPLYYLRTFAEDELRSGLYLLPLPEALDGFSCYLDDDAVPGTKAHEKAQADLEAALESFETDALRHSRTAKRGVRQ